MKKSMITVNLLAVALVTSSFAQDRAGRVEKVPGLSFHAVSTTPASGYQQATFDGQTYFVSPKAIIGADQVTNVQTAGSSLTLSGNFADLGKANQLGVLVDGQLVGVGSAAVQRGQITITGLTPTQTQRVTHLLSRKADSVTGAAFTVVPGGQVNGEYVFEVYIKNVPELRTYQVKLEATGGTAGALNMTDVRIDKSRPDYVFSGSEAVDAADHSGSRLGGTLLTSSPVAVEGSKYVGTWKFRPTSDATGSFNVNVVAGAETFIADMQNRNLPVGAVGATVQIGSAKSRVSE